MPQHCMCCSMASTSFNLMVQGDKVKFSLQFRGREMQFQEEGSKMFQVGIHGCEDLHISSVMPCISAAALKRSCV